MLEKYRIEFSRNPKYKNEVSYPIAFSAKDAVAQCKSSFGKDIVIKEVCKVCEINDSEEESG